MRTIKSLFVIAVAVLLSCSVSFAVTDLTANGSTIIKPNIKDGILSVTVFDDVRIPSGTGTTGATYYSNPVDIGALDFTRGSNRDVAYLSVGFAHANTQTANGVTVTYQLSSDGKNFFTPRYLNIDNTTPNQSPYGIFGTAIGDGFDVNEGPADKHPTYDRNTAANIAGGAGPYCPTNTKVVEVTVTAARYIRFQIWGETGLNIGDLFIMGATRQLEAD